MQSILFRLMISTILPALTPALREMLENFVTNFVAYAKTTPNKVDDVVAEMLCNILGIEYKP
jgi:hypothetical protein